MLYSQKVSDLDAAYIKDQARLRRYDEGDNRVPDVGVDCSMLFSSMAAILCKISHRGPVAVRPYLVEGALAHGRGTSCALAHELTHHPPRLVEEKHFREAVYTHGHEHGLNSRHHSFRDPLLADIRRLGPDADENSPLLQVPVHIHDMGLDFDLTLGDLRAHGEECALERVHRVAHNSKEALGLDHVGLVAVQHHHNLAHNVPHDRKRVLYDGLPVCLPNPIPAHGLVLLLGQDHDRLIVPFDVGTHGRPRNSARQLVDGLLHLHTYAYT